MKFETFNLKLFYSKKEFLLFFVLILVIFSINTLLHYKNYLQFTEEELYEAKGQIMAVYPKVTFDIVKIEGENSVFFTQVSKIKKLKTLDKVELIVISKNINFLSYIKGFYAKSFIVQKIESSSLKQRLTVKVNNQHKDERVSELFGTLFFANTLGKELRKFCALFGISHLVALSGFHLSILGGFIYFFVYHIYSRFHAKYCPYRNKKYDTFLICSIVLFLYVLFTGIVPSLLRAFVMYVLALFFLRMNMKVFSFQTLLIVCLCILALFPRYIFSLSLWFSLCAVFYIFLFLQYFKSLHKVGQFVLFNVWIFLVMNPISHYFFPVTSMVQLFSPLLTLGFTLFYPLELVLHLFGQGSLLDDVIIAFLNIQVYEYKVFTPAYFFYFFLILSLFSIWSQKIFICLNVLLVLFSIYLYV